MDHNQIMMLANSVITNLYENFKIDIFFHVFAFKVAGTKKITKILWLVSPAESLFGKILNLWAAFAKTVALPAAAVKISDPEYLEYISHSNLTLNLPYSDHSLNF